MKRTLIKTAIYKTFVMCELAVIAYALTGTLEEAGKLGVVHTAISTISYFAFEKLFELYWSVKA